MNEGLIPRRYATALFKVAAERNDSERLYTMMQNVAAAFAGDAELQRVVANPFVSDKDKISLLTVAAGAESTDATYDDFLRLLSRNKRLDIMGAIARDYCLLYRRARNIRRVIVTSAAPLDDKSLDRLKKLIEDHLAGATMEFSSQVDPGLIGGFTVTVDNERLDASVRNELKQLRLNLLN